MSFETELRRRMNVAADAVVVPRSMQDRVLRRARRRRRATVAGSVLALCALVTIVAMTPWAGPRGADVLPPVGPSSASHLATPVGNEPCGYGDVVPAQHPDLPSDASCAWAAPGDFDGDGQRDTIFSFGIGGDQDPTNRRWLESTWHLRAVLGDGSVSSANFESAMKLGMPLVPRVIGTVDADGDGDSEIFLAPDIGNGAAAVIYSLDDGTLSRVSDVSTGRPVRFEVSIAAGANFSSGLGCSDADASQDPALVVTTAEQSSDKQLLVTKRRYEWISSTEVRREYTREEKISSDRLAHLDELSRLDCRGLVWRP